MFVRPTLVSPARPRPIAHSGRRSPHEALAGLGELGDVVSGAQPISDLIGLIKTGIIDKQGIMNLGGGLQNALHVAKNTYNNGANGSLPTAFQNSWNAWKRTAQPGDSNSNIWWMFAVLTAKWADRLINAANANPALLNDAAVTKVSYTLVDTSQSGTTWYGGTVVTSKLTNVQWAGVFTKAYDTIASGIVAGVLPFSMLAVLCKGVLAQPVARKFPTFNPPQGTGTDPEAIAWRAAMKQLGWSSVVNTWFAYTQQAWAAQNAAADQLDASYGAVITSLNYLSGKAIIDQIFAKVSDMAKERSAAVRSIQDVEKVLGGPLASYIPAGKIKTFNEVKALFADVDGKTNAALGKVGMWPPQSGLGVLPTMIIAGTVGVAILGMCGWLLALWTSVSRTAAAQSKEVADSILATVDEVKASCIREFNASGKNAEDETKLQTCLLKTKELIAAVPRPPSNPMGMGSLAVLAAAGLGALVVFKGVPKLK